MLRVMKREAFEQWCAKRGHDQESARFHLESCYFGKTLRSRPGALFLFEDELVHHSYRWRDSFWALFEPSVEVRVAIGEIAELKRGSLTPFWNFMFMNPESAFEVRMKNGDTHWFMLQRGGKEFEAAWNSIQCVAVS